MTSRINSPNLTTPTVLCRFRQRLGPDGFETLFNQVVEQARSRGFITDHLHIIDSTHIVA